MFYQSVPPSNDPGAPPPDAISNIAFTTGKNVYCPGETIFGQLHFTVASKNTGTLSLRNFAVAFQGIERTCVHYTTTSGSGKQRKTHHHYAKATRNLVTNEIVLPDIQFPGTSPVTTVPFSLMLPLGLPSSADLPVSVFSLSNFEVVVLVVLV
jgi:hypothetical protein